MKIVIAILIFGILVLVHELGHFTFAKLFYLLKIKDNKRPVMIHAQTVRPDQLAFMKRIHMIPSFFVEHTYYWGDTHLENLGEERAFHISPLKTAIENGVMFTLHQDTPVVPPDMLHTVWCAVNRVTKSGMTLGEDEKITPHALRATFGTLLYDRTHDIELVRQQMNHESVATTQRYIRGNEEANRKRTADVMGSIISSGKKRDTGSLFGEE
mgnify:CR=1 FL=1